MNRHETHPVRGRVFDEEHARADLILMKRHSVNAIRTSHYPPHPQVLDLADELGFWVIVECDLETHGFVFRRLAGQSERRPALGGGVPGPDRAHGRAGQEPPVRGHLVAGQRVRHRHATSPQMAHWVRRRDPERPVHYEGDYTGAYTDVYSRMYPEPCRDRGDRRRDRAIS